MTHFDTTRWSVVRAAASSRPAEARQALEALCSTYWYPIYAYIRHRGYAAEDAKDLNQEFFARFLEKDYLKDVDPVKGRFRSFLLASVNHFLSNERDRARTLKRGGIQPRRAADGLRRGRPHAEPSRCAHARSPARTGSIGQGSGARGIQPISRSSRVLRRYV